MAEPATQSPYISSSAGGGSSEPGGRELKGAGSPQPCADSFVSSSQPVSLFSTSQGTAPSPPPAAGKSASEVAIPPSPAFSASAEAHSENQRGTDCQRALSNAAPELVDGQKRTLVPGAREWSGLEAAVLESSGQEKSSSSSTGSKVLDSSPVVQAVSLEHSHLKGEVPIGGTASLRGSDQHFMDQTQKVVSGEESKLALLASPKGEPEHPPARVTHSHSTAPPALAGETVVEKDSPESPFEVIADKLEFDKEFRDVLTSGANDIGSNWVMHGERELLTDIPEDSVCEFRVKPRAGGRVPSGPGLSRQSSGTSAALEEVSRCVREMHSFTSELLNWDLIPKDLDDKPDNLASTVLPVSPIRDARGGLAGATNGKGTSGNASSPLQPLTISVHQKGRPVLEAEKKPAAVNQEPTAMKTSPTAVMELKADVCWPNPSLPEAADADSSGESDDTVIEDATADPLFQNESGSGSNSPPKLVASVKAEPGAISNSHRSSELQEPAHEDGAAFGTPECNWGFIDDFETLPARADGGSPAAEAPLPKLSAPCAVQELGTCEQDLLVKRPKMGGPSVAARGALPLESLKEAVCPDALTGESFMDFMKECLKAKGSESPEDPVETFSEAELKAARSQVLAPHSRQPPKATQDFEQEHLTIKALKEVGRKTEVERQPPALNKVSPPGGRQLGQSHDTLPDPPVQKSALEKRPLCLAQAVEVKLASASAGLGRLDALSEPARASSPEAPVPRALRKLLAQFSVRDLIFWRDVKKTGLVFSTTLILLLSLAAFSVISVVSYLILALLSVTISFRVYKSVIQAVQKSEEGHPFKAYLDVDVALSSEAFHNYVSSAMVHVNQALKLIMRLFLVEDLVDSLKLAVVMWLMTYVGAIFNGITLLILAELLVFSVPVVYEKYKTQIDHYVGIARDQIKSFTTKVQAKLPGVVKKKPE
ncbi:reticulon-3 isoform X2 [Hemicordylus capensis]|uniref:reticulon-3 isoform X2 n=1 Tax=Hemicordylus capensis TaxID=884348 RepID=UPI002302C070|nr:reticulon-3 isoform X2 [Hemicordylus capensis]